LTAPARPGSVLRDPLDAVQRRIAAPSDTAAGAAEDVVWREWLVTNGLGGYACGTLTGRITRRYHGLLAAALPAPLGRCMMLAHLSERVRLEDRSVAWLGPHEDGGRLVHPDPGRNLAEFRLDGGLPAWRHEVGRSVIEKTVLMPHGQNTVHVGYRLLSGPAGGVRLTLRPLVAFRPHEAPVDRRPTQEYVLTARGRRIEIAGEPGMPPLRLVLEAAQGAFTVDDQAIGDVRYLLEEHRGYVGEGPLWSPGYFRLQLRPDEEATFIASVEPWATIVALGPHEVRAAERARRRRLLEAAHPAARSGVAGELVLAADQFVVQPAVRADDAARAHAAGGESRTIIAGYPWFTDWGRDTMISLEGLTLVTGRHAEARDILRTFASHARDGLIPNLFPEGGREGLYHTADATLWYFHALHRYLTYTGDRGLLRELLPMLRSVVQHHLAGTRFGIRVDPADGLLTQGAPGYQLTWMDAKVDDWVVTPRRGKAVEINALWYNALRLLEGWLAQEDAGDEARAVGAHAERARRAFDMRFWNPARGFLFDVVDGEQGDDPACRPNQLLAIALPHPVLARERWPAVLDVVRARLLTPVGLRSLAPGNPDYKARYFGDLRARDAAYHQGTVWSWLIGPYVDAVLAAAPDDASDVRAAIEPMLGHLDQACVGSVSEIFDAEPPFTPRGCFAQAWGVAELLRVLVRTADETDRPSS
jgi:predicted glycogen debranching enzyme